MHLLNHARQLARGAAAFLEKPLDTQQLLAAICSTVTGRTLDANARPERTQEAGNNSCGPHPEPTRVSRFVQSH
jgi:FixJ family two-component response regulator